MKRILVVDDESISRRLLKALLEPLGYEVTLASNGEEALEYFKEYPFSFVLMDFNMPKMDGVKATEKIRRLEKKPNAYIVGLTAWQDQSRLEEGIKAGMNLVCLKPITVELMNKICQEYKINSQKSKEYTISCSNEYIEAGFF